MNIFYLHNDPVECAKLHNDKHVVKMILEYAQLLSTAHRFLDGSLVSSFSDTGRKRQTYTLNSPLDSHLYMATHVNHPSAIWVRQSEHNYNWLYSLWIALMNEYTYRYGKIHAASRLIPHLANPPENIPVGVFTEPTPAMPEEYKVKGNSIQAYINYYVGAKKHLASWKKRTIPSWYVIN